MTLSSFFGDTHFKVCVKSEQFNEFLFESIIVNLRPLECWKVLHTVIEKVNAKKTYGIHDQLAFLLQ